MRVVSIFTSNSQQGSKQGYFPKCRPTPLRRNILPLNININVMQFGSYSIQVIINIKTNALSVPHSIMPSSVSETLWFGEIGFDHNITKHHHQTQNYKLYYQILVTFCTLYSLLLIKCDMCLMQLFPVQMWNAGKQQGGKISHPVSLQHIKTNYNIATLVIPFPCEW